MGILVWERAGEPGFIAHSNESVNLECKENHREVTILLTSRMFWPLGLTLPRTHSEHGLALARTPPEQDRNLLSHVAPTSVPSLSQEHNQAGCHKGSCVGSPDPGQVSLSAVSPAN